MTNFVVIVADDQTYGHLDFMPFARDMAGAGRVFSGCRLEVGLCQPSRMALYTGKKAKDSLCYGNLAADLAGVNLNNTLAKWLDDAGYRTGLIGKWTNGQVGTETKPTGWDVWRKFKSAGTGPGVGNDVWDGSSTTTTTTHQLDYILSQFTTFLSGSEPFFVMLCPEMPHVPYAPRVADMFKFRRSQYTVPAETDVSDKPAWIQAFTQMTETEKRVIRYSYRQSLREVAGVDWLIKSVYDMLDLTDTVLFFVSDNGFNFGDHNRRESDADPFPKSDAYEPSLHVPLVAVGSGFTAGTTTQPTQIQDITATIVAMSGATAPWTLAGVDLRDVQNNPSTYNTRKLLHQVRALRCPDCDIITSTGGGAAATRKLIRYYGDTVATLLPNGNVSQSNTIVVGAPSRYEALDDTSEAEYVQGTANTAAEFIVDLQDGVNPNYVTRTEPYTWSFRASRSSSSDLIATAELRQGTTVIDTQLVLLTSTLTTYSQDLTAAKIANITDYTQLRLRFVQEQGVAAGMRIYYASMLIPTRSYEAYDLDTDPTELANWAAVGGRLTERNALEADLDALL